MFEKQYQFWTAERRSTIGKLCRFFQRPSPVNQDVVQSNYQFIFFAIHIIFCTRNGWRNRKFKRAFVQTAKYQSNQDKKPKQQVAINNHPLFKPLKLPPTPPTQNTNI